LAELKEEVSRNQIEVALIENRLSAFSFGGAIDFKAELALINVLAKKDSSLRVQNLLLSVLSKAAFEDLSNASPEFQATLASTRRYLSSDEIFALALSSEKLRPLILANEKAKVALKHYLSLEKGFPKTCDSSRLPVRSLLATSIGCLKGSPEKPLVGLRKLEQQELFCRSSVLFFLVGIKNPTEPRPCGIFEK